MSTNFVKAILIAVWGVLVFGCLWVLQSAYEESKDQPFWFFLVIAIGGNLAYDGLKSILKYRPLAPCNGSKLAKLVGKFVLLLALSFAALAVPAVLVVKGCLNDRLGQLLAGIGFLTAWAVGASMLATIGKYFKASDGS